MKNEGTKGFGRIPNALVESGAWALFDPYMRSVYTVLLTICKRQTTYEDRYGRWSDAREGFSTTKRLAKLSGVRRSSISLTTEALAKVGLITKTPWRINDSARCKYIILPPDHPICHSVWHRKQELQKRKREKDFSEDGDLGAKTTEGAETGEESLDFSLASNKRTKNPLVDRGMETITTKRYTLHLDEQDMKTLERLARAETKATGSQVTVARIVRRLIKEFLRGQT